MAWTAADINRLSQGTNGSRRQWTAEDVQSASRGTNHTVAPTPTKQSTASASSGSLQHSVGGNTKNQETDTLYADALEQYRANHNLGLADAVDARNEGRDTDVYTTVNNWKDASDRNKELARLVTKEFPVELPDQTTEVDWNGTGAGVNPNATHKLTDAELRKQGYSQQEINTARKQAAVYDNLGLAEIAKRRIGNSVKSVPANLAGGAAMFISGLADQMTDSAEEQMVRCIQSGRYTDAQLTEAGYDPQLVQKAHERLDAGKLTDDVRDEENPLHGVYNWGKETHQKGEDLLADAQAGETDVQRFWHGAAVSAGENLAVGAVNPALVLPVLSAQGAGDSMAQSDAKGEDMGKALLKATAKFGAGWAINSVGAADLARTMGSGYARDTMAGQLADFVRGLADNGALAQQYPAVANALSGGIDNAMQAFVETYADKAIDAALGDEEAAQTFFDKDTFLSALESGLSGGASGALGGAVGTGLGAVRGRLAQGVTGQPAVSGERPLRYGQPQQTQADAGSVLPTEARGDTAAQGSVSEAGSYSAEEAKAALSKKAALAEETSVNDDPATHTVAQNASIAEYKDSVDPKLAEYVDRVRAGEKLDPYVVTETSDRMRSAMLELTGLEKVGDRTLMDANAVQHITNRHAGGDGSADGTMKNSADVARAAYVLNNFDNAYLATRKADGYFDKRGKRAPIVIFEKKIDGSHIIVEAVTDTKRGRNYIVSEYLSSVGVDPKEIAKALRPPMDAAESDPRHTSETLNEETSAMTASTPQSSMNVVADPRDTSETLAEDYDATESIAPEHGSVKERNVEKAGESVEKDYADEALHVELGELDADGWAAEQRQAARQLAQNAQMSTQAAQTVVDNMPDGVGAALYTRAANTLYRLGVSGVETFEKALDLTGSGTLGGAIRQVMSLGQRGENALRMAFLQGRGEAEAYHEKAVQELAQRPRPAALREDAGVYYKDGSTPSKGSDGLDAFIELGAKATGTTVHRVLDGLRENARAYIQTATSEIFLSGRAGAETMMHETLHELNSWSAETGQEYIDTLMNYLVQANGMESTDALVRSYIDRYAAAGQRLTYNRAAEEVAADSMQTVFGDAEGLRNFARQQAYEAEANARARGTIDRVMGKIKSLLEAVLKDVENLLTKEPTNAAAKAAKSLTKEQLKDLQALYFDHQRQAGENYRAALEANENAPAQAKAASDEAGEVKYQIDEGFEKAIDELDVNSRYAYQIRVGTTSEVLKSIGVKDQTIVWNSNKIRKILAKHSAENFRAGIDHSIMTKEILKQVPQVLEHPILVVHSDTTRNTDYASRIFMYGDVKDATGKPVNVSLELLPTDHKGLAMENIVLLSAYGHDSYRPGRVLQGEVLYADPDIKRTSNWLRDNRLLLPFSLASAGPKAILRYRENDVKAVTVEPLPGQRKYYLKAITEEQAQKLYPAEDVKADGTKYQLDVDPEDVETTKTTGLGNVDEQVDTIRQAVEAGGKVRLSDQTVNSIARAVLSDTSSKMNAKTLAERIRAMSDYIALTEDVSWEDVYSFASDMAEQVMSKSAKKNDELWRQYPELHKMSMKIEKGSKNYWEIVYRWGSWANARKELARHGVNITQTKEGEHSRWDADFTELQKIGAGLLPSETPNSAAEALEAMAAAHDTIRPTMENAYEEDWEGAKQDIAMQLLLRYLNSPEVATKQNVEYRKAFTDQWKKMRAQAKQEVLEARAKVFADQARFAQELKNAKDEAAKANAGRAAAKMREDAIADRAKQLREKQRTEMNVRMQLMKNKAAQQLQKARDAREMDTTRRSIRRLTSDLTQMTKGKNERRNVPNYLLGKVLPVAKLANEVVGNKKAAMELARMKNELFDGKTAPKDMERAMQGLGSGIQSAIKAKERDASEWENSGLSEAIADWLEDVNDSRQIEMEKLRGEMANAEQWLTEDTPEKKAYLDRLRADLKAYEDGNLATLNVDQLRGLRDILEQTVYIIRNENKLLGQMEQANVDAFAEGMHKELEGAKGLKFGKGWKGKVDSWVGTYKLDTLNIERQFERLGGYVHGGYMEQVGRMLNEGQYKKTKLLVEGTALFDDVTGKGHLKQMDRFTHELLDIGLRADDGRKWYITRNEAVALYFQAQNLQGLHHMTHGGLKIMNMEDAVKGDTRSAEHDTQTIRIGDLKFDEEGHILNKENVAADEAEVMQLLAGQRTNLLEQLSSIVNEEGEMGEYTRAVIEDYKAFEAFTKKNINETSMVLSGRAKARVENYIPMRVDEGTRAVENTGIRYDNSVGSEGFLKERVNSSKPIYLDGIFRVVNTSLENVAQYAGMAIPLRNVEKLLSTQVEGRNINAEIKAKWGDEGEAYLKKAIEDLYPNKNRAELGDKTMAKMRGVAAGAVLTFNLNVTLLQAASLPTAAAELGWGSTGHAAVQFGRNLRPDPVNRLMRKVGIHERGLKTIEAEIAEHGDTLLQYRLRGTQSGELGTAAEVKNWMTQLHDGALDSNNKLVSGLTSLYDTLKGSIAKMDEVTVAALWEGAKDYVVKHPAEFDAEAQQKGSAAYWDAVNRAYQRVIERTQPNYTAMQRTGFQRSGNQMLKFLMMYSTQRQQNMQIVVSAAEDAAAQAARYKADPTEENKAALAEAESRKARAISSQVTAAGVISLMSLVVKFVLHRRKDMQDENGDLSWKKTAETFALGMLESLASNPVGGSELYTTASVIREGTDYDAVSVSGVSGVNDLVAALSTLWKEAGKDTAGMDADDYAKHVERMKKDWNNVAGSAAQLLNIPYNNLKKYVDAVTAYMDDIKNGTLLDFDSIPESATSQYDRLYNAIQSGDADEVQAATAKLERMKKEGAVKELNIDAQLKKRLKQYDESILAAAEANNAGKVEARKDAKQEVFDKLCAAYGVKKLGEPGATAEDAAQRKKFIQLIDEVVKAKADELLKGDGSSIYNDLTDALDTGRAQDVQDEVERLLTAGKEASSIKTELTKAAKSEYLAGNDRDRERLETLLLKLKDGDGKALYEKKNFEQWVKEAKKKKDAAAQSEDEGEGVR